MRLYLDSCVLIYALEGAPHLQQRTLQPRGQQRDANMLASLQRVSEREKATRRHEVARVSIGAAYMKTEFPPQDGGKHHPEESHHEQRSQSGCAVIETV